MKELVSCQFGESRHISSANFFRRCGQIGGHPFVLLVPQHVLDPLPTQVGLALLQDEQVGKGEQESVTGNVEALPPETAFETRFFTQKFTGVAKAGVIFDAQEQTCGKVPDASSDDQAYSLSPELLLLSASRCKTCHSQERAHHHQGPTPGPLDEKHVKEIVSLSKIV